MKLQALIVDDEYNSRENLSIMLNTYCPEVEVVAQANSANEARTILDENKNIEILFLDISMPEEDGFSLLESYPNRNFAVIFVTAHNQYALDAFKVNAVDYLEKPVDINDLQRAVEKAQKLRNESSIIDSSQSNINSTHQDKISIPTQNGYIFVKNQDIIRLEASENYTKIFMIGNQKIISSKTIKTYENMLNSDIFFRPHKSHIVNIYHHMISYNRDNGTSILMSDNSIIPISRRKHASFIKRIRN